MKFLIAGASGQLAKAFIERFENDGIEYLAPLEGEFDITSPEMIAQVVNGFKPNVLINCAAYNNVDQAEKTPEPAMLVNSKAPGLLATECNKHGIKFVHYSSDYVFDGKKEGLYNESDSVNPLNQYGKSKLSGEQEVLSADKSSLVFRLSWVYGKGEQNFLYKLSQWSKGRDVIKVVYDQVSVPTYTIDIVDATLRAIEKGLSGLYHLTNTGYGSRFEVARCFFKALGGGPEMVIPVPSSMFPSPVERPFISAMSNKKLVSDIGGGYSIPGWEDAIMRYAMTIKNL